MDIGPVELVVLSFPGEQADSGVVEAVMDVVSKGYVTILDMTFVSRLQDGQIRIVDIDDDLDPTGLSPLRVEGRALLNDEDVGVIGESLLPGTSAAVIVYEESWARQVAAAVRDAGGEVELHLQLPRDTVEAAVVAAELTS